MKFRGKAFFEPFRVEEVAFEGLLVIEFELEDPFFSTELSIWVPFEVGALECGLGLQAVERKDRGRGEERLSVC